MATVEELTAELQQTRLQLEIEKQKYKKLETELESLRKRGSGGFGGPTLGTLGGGTPGPLTTPLGMAPPAPRPAAGVPAPAAPVADESGDDGPAADFTGDREFQEKKRQLDKVTAEKHEVEQRKWTIDKENIALKEALNKLKVQGQNSQKIIEEQAEKLDRKENQNFKTRLELTDLRKALHGVEGDKGKQEETLARLKLETAELLAEIRHYKAVIEQEQQRRDAIQSELNRTQDVLAQYQSGFLSRFYDK